MGRVAADGQKYQAFIRRNELHFQEEQCLSQNEPIYITSQIFGHKLVKVGDGYKVNISTDFLVIDDTGNVLGGQQNVYSLENISAIPMTDFTLDLTYTLSGASEGIYNLQTTVNDKNSGKSTKFVTKIEIK